MEGAMKAVFLDTKTLGDDVSFDILQKLPFHWSFFEETSPKETLERVKGAQVVVSNKVILSKEILEKCPALKLICVAATGYNNVDTAAAKDLGIVVCNCPGYSTPSVVQLAASMIFALATRLVEYAGAVKRGLWQKSSQFCMLDFPIIELKGKKLGIIGYGALGKELAQLMRALGMEILIAESRSTKEGRLPLHEVLRESDVVSIHAPLTDETRNLIRKKELRLMKRSAFLINTARGGIVDEHDLAEALKEGLIAGAGVDVLSKEPPSADNPLLQSDVPNLILMPHVGWASIESRRRLLEVIRMNIQLFLEGKPQNLV
jgi:glycerate dehydrogenase